MAGNADNLLLKVGDPGSATTLDANYTAGDSSITVVSTSNWTATGEGVIFAMDTVTVVDGEEVQDAGSYNEFEGTVASATSITNVDWVRGSGDTNYSAGSTTRVYIPVSAERENRIVDWGAAEHSVVDGTHTDITADSIVTTGDVEAASFTVTGQTTGLLGAIHRYTYDGTDIYIDGVSQSNGANTITWTKPSNLKFIVVEVQGGGGAGGGCAATSGTQIRAGAGGGAGSYSRSKIAAGSLGATETITVGAKGAGVSGSTGGNGGQSSFGSHTTAPGGSGGGQSSAATPSNGSMVAGGAGGTAGTGDIALRGAYGETGGTYANNNNVGAGGAGGNSPFGRGGYGQVANNSGGDASGYGAGGGAGARNVSLSAITGGDGAAGIVIVYEYF